MRRVRFVKILRDVVGLPTETIRTVLEAMGRAARVGTHPAYEVLSELPLDPRSLTNQPEPDPELVAEVTQTLRDLPWTTSDERHFHAREIAQILHAIRSTILPGYGRQDLEALAEAAWNLSAAEFAAARAVAPSAPVDGGDGPILRAVLGTLLLEPLLLALRRNANTARAAHMAREQGTS